MFQDLLNAVFSGLPTYRACTFLLGFNGLALVLEVLLPGKTQTGPETLTGHVPVYKDNGFLHCIVFTLLFFVVTLSSLYIATKPISSPPVQLSIINGQVKQNVKHQLYCQASDVGPIHDTKIPK